MTEPTLTIEPCPELDPGGRFIALDCEHGRTTLLHGGAPSGRPDAVRVPDAWLVMLLASKHEDEEGCGCAAVVLRCYAGTAG